MLKNAACRYFLPSVFVVLSLLTVVAAQEDYSAWPNSQKVILNTTSTGANISGNLYGFPVLIRLTPANFSGFGSTMPQGADVRFAKSNGTPLPYEIERWVDVSGNADTAEIWVRVDTVFGNNSTQYFLMYWGRNGATSRSNGSAVFDTAGGYVAVYHLKEYQDNAADATANGLHAARIGMPARSPGIAGYGQSFNGSDSYYKTNAFDKCGFGTTFTVSSWIYLPSSFGNYGALWSKGSDDLTWSQDEVQFYLGNNTIDQNQQGRYPQLVGNARDWMNGTMEIGTNAWHLVHFVYRASDNTRQIFVDGQPVTLDSRFAPYRGGNDVPGHLFFIGRDISPEACNNFHGVMDEVQVSKVVRSANWIKLCYENQKPNQSLITFAVIDDENYATWPYSQKVYLNTTASGANVTPNVTKFPLLIRLNPSTFKSLAQTQTGGADIRFAKSNGMHLPYEIERWVDGPANSDTAEIWVRLDTVFGNSNKQYVLMYWGKSGVQSRSNAAAVFDTADHYRGVWHCNENPAASSGAIRDRTVFGNHGTAQNGLAADDCVSGIIGKSLNFDGPTAGGGDWLRLPNGSSLDITGSLFISCWFRMTNGATTDYYGIAGKYADGGGVYSGYGLCRADNQYVRFIVGTGSGSAPYVASNTAINDNRWHHIAGAVNANTLYLFVDGVLQGARATGTPVASGTYGAFGRQSGSTDYRYFVGDLDEVQISRIARPPEWVKLAYENQRENQTVVLVDRVDNENYATWPYSQRILLNTGASGANVSGNVVLFPVLVRLNPGVFAAFSQTQPGGADIRFAKPNGVHLPYEIERWIDGPGNNDTAEIWVRVDTILGNNTSQYIIMYWGKTGVGSMASPRDVFDTDHGFAGVWHLSNNDFSDATENLFAVENSGTDDTVAVIGGGRKFVDPDFMEVPGLMGMPSRATLSCWAKITTRGSGGADLISIGDYVIMRSTPSGLHGVYHFASGWRTDTVPLTGTDSWKYLAFVCDPSNNRQQLYIDGQPALPAGTFGDSIIYAGAGSNTRFGRHGHTSTTNNFGGLLDEIRIDNVARSADWIKLCYANQKPNQTLVALSVVDNENYATWPYFQKIYLNTSQSGANVAEPVTGFPVLIRLTPSVFKNFAQTLPGGADIRFAKSNGVHLPYEIERWVDGANNNDTAEIWVRLDTVLGNNSTQFILMYWGKSGVSSRSDPATVFETAQGFQGVWHLNESPVGTAAIKDRTKNGNHGTPQNNLTSDDQVNGVIGKAVNFDGPVAAAGDYIRIPNSSVLDNTGNMTVSAWFRLSDGGSSDYFGIAGKYRDSNPNYYGYVIGRAQSQRVRFSIGTGGSGAGSFVESNSTLIDNNWHYAVGTVTAGTLRLYLDGVAQSATATGVPLPSGDYAVIGRRAGNLDNSYFIGDIDEVRFCNTARSAAWIKLCYENQRAAQTLVSFSSVDNEDYATWANAQKIYINTTANGANISTSLTGFPLLVRLNPGTFPYFSGTQPGGADIRFSSPTGRHLPFEIERWIDGPGNNDTAEIWVNVDTVRGNNALQYIRMHWGKPGALSTGNAREVFDIAGGFVANYHLGENDGAALDATANALNAAPKGSLPNRREGYIGYCAMLNGQATYYNAGNDPRFGVSATNALTISAWVNRAGSNAFRVPFEGITGKHRWASGNAREYVLACDTSNGNAGFGFYTSADGSSAAEQFTQSRVVPKNNTWYHVTGSYDGSTVRIYVDGVLRSTTSRNAIYSSLNADFKIGLIDSSSPSYIQSWNGRIDEVSVSRVARSADWIKLSYETQRTGNQCVVIPEHLSYPVVVEGTPGDLSVSEGQPVALTVRVSGCGPFQFRWYKNNLSPSDTVAGQTDSTFRLASAKVLDAGRYFCVVRNVYGMDTSRPALLSVTPNQQVNNPITLTGRFVDSTHVSVSVLRYSGLPEVPTATFPWQADSVWIWYSASGYPQRPLPGEPDVIKLPMSLLRQTPGDQFDTLITVRRYPAADCYSYYFLPSVYWKNSAAGVDSIAPFGDPAVSGTAVYMCDTSTIANPLTFSFLYTVPSDSILLTLANLTRLEWNLVAGINVRYTVGGTNTTVTDYLPAAGFDRSADIFRKKYRDPRFNGEEKWIYWEVVPVGKYGNKGEVVRDSCKVGVPRPENTVSLSIASVTATTVGLSWTRPRLPVDSIRIWYGIRDVPLHFDIPHMLFGAITLMGSDTAGLITGLAAGTDYYFGLQVLKGGLWSLVTQASRAWTTTLEVTDTTPLPNRLRLLSVTFDTLQNDVVLQWVVDTAGLKLEAGVVWSKDSVGYPSPRPPIIGKVTPIANPQVPMTFRISMATTDLLFNSDYFFAVWLRKVDGLWAQPTPAAIMKLHIPAAIWEQIVFFRTTDTVRALAGNLVLSKIENMLVESKVRLLDLPVGTSGCIPMSRAISFDHSNAPPLPLHVGLTYGQFPQGYGERDLRMYHYVAETGVWLLDTFPASFDTVRRIYSVEVLASECTRYPFMVMIDTVAPVITLLKDTDDPLPPRRPYTFSVETRDNIANTMVTMQGGRGSDRLSAPLSFSAHRPCDTVSWTLDGAMVSDEYGVRVLVTVSDGRRSMTVNGSRDVIRTSSDSIVPGWLQWVPIGSNAVLDNPSIGSILRDHADKNGMIHYDNTSFRLFRWSSREWQEFESKDQAAFDLTPGRVVWLKRRLTSPIYLGKGRTASLRTPYRIPVPAKGWVDFCIPYRFNILVGDVLAASGQRRDSSALLLYEWRKNTGDSLKRYFAEAVFLPLTAGKDDPRFELTGRNGTVYTVYNGAENVVDLVIPGIPLPLSSVAEKRPATEGWSVTVTATSNDGPLNPVYCSYRPGGKGMARYPQSPSWTKVQMGVYDREKHAVQGGLVIRHDLPEGGYTYELVFENRTTQRKEVLYRIQPIGVSGEAPGTMIIDPETGVPSECHDALTVSIEPGGRVYRLLAVGTAAYLGAVRTLPFIGEFTLLKTTPNPFKRSLRIRYQLPYGSIEWLRCEVFDPRGRKLWDLQIGPRIHPGVNEVVWTPRADRALAAGTYLVRLSGFDGRNRKIGERFTRATYLP